MAKLQKAAKRASNGAGSIYKDKRDSKWYYSFTDPITGKRKVKLLAKDLEDGTHIPVTTEAEAKKAAETIRITNSQLNSLTTAERAQAEMARTHNLIVGMTIKVADIWQLFLDSPTRNQETSTKRMNIIKLVFEKFVLWCSENGIVSANQITAECINKFVRYSASSLSSSTRKMYLAAMRMILRHTYKSLGMNSNPAQDIKGIKEVNVSHEAFTEEQIAKIFQGFDTHFPHEVTRIRTNADGTETEYTFTQEYTPKCYDELRIAMMIALYTGARCKDCCLMKWSNIDLENRIVSYVPAKTVHSSRKKVEVPIFTEEFSNALWQAESWKKDNAEGEDYVCPNLAKWYSENPSNVIFVIGTIIEHSLGISRKCESTEDRRNKANRYGMHSFRHSFVTRCWNAGVKLEIVADIVGHTSALMTETYLHKDIERTRQEFKNCFKGQLVAPCVSDETINIRREIESKLSTASIEQLRAILEMLNGDGDSRLIEC